MTRRKLLGFALFCAALGLAIVSTMPAVFADPPKDGIRIGMANTFFNDVPAIFVDIVTEPFGKLLKQTTGLDGKLLTDDDAFGLANKLEAKQMQFGVFHGHEFAWVQKKHPELTPILVVANRQHDVRAFVIVHRNSKFNSIADLRGKNIDIPLATKQHARVFLTKHCTNNAQPNLNEFFTEIKKSSTPMDALDDLCRGKSDAVLVDSIGLSKYKALKQFHFQNNLWVLKESEAFPSAVIAYRQGAVDAATVTKFRDGLLKAHENAVGRDMMQMWSIEAFELPPQNYSQSLAECLKAYPLPEATKVSMRMIRATPLPPSTGERGGRPENDARRFRAMNSARPPSVFLFRALIFLVADLLK